MEKGGQFGDLLEFTQFGSVRLVPRRHRSQPAPEEGPIVTAQVCGVVVSQGDLVGKATAGN